MNTSYLESNPLKTDTKVGNDRLGLFTGWNPNHEQQSLQCFFDSARHILTIVLQPSSTFILLSCENT